MEKIDATIEQITAVLYDVDRELLAAWDANLDAAYVALVAARRRLKLYLDAQQQKAK